MRTRVLTTSAALLFSLAATLLVGGGSGIDWPADGETAVVQARAEVGDIDWP
ncbi:hypothetical protein [Streptomyces sp. NPDC057002]|uniref:hypothetical protein n=1 Tax=Streptomyces sp. NPDC057002 TaxID=3345992 RepID=UPI00362A4F6C